MSLTKGLEIHIMFISIYLLRIQLLLREKSLTIKATKASKKYTNQSPLLDNKIHRSQHTEANRAQEYASTMCSTIASTTNYIKPSYST